MLWIAKVLEDPSYRVFGLGGGDWGGSEPLADLTLQPYMQVLIPKKALRVLRADKGKGRLATHTLQCPWSKQLAVSGSALRLWSEPDVGESPPLNTLRTLVRVAPVCTL